MDVDVSNRVGVGATVVLVTLGVAVAGHVWIDEVVVWIQWLITDVLEPRFGLTDRLW